MALVLSAKQDKSGSIKRFDVVRAQDGDLSEVLDAIPAGDYHVLGEDNKVTKHRVSYRIVQDIDPID